MIDPEQFYQKSDNPSSGSRRRMWRSIESRIGPRSSPWLVLERRSFMLGMAATVIMLLAGVGAVSAVNRLIDNARPEAARVDRAYMSAISQFEDLTARLTPTSATKGTAPELQSRRDRFLSRQEELQSLDLGIEQLRADLRTGELSPVSRARLRDLYSRKLIVLLDMIEQGEITI